MRLITVVLNTRSVSVRTQESQALLNYGFRFFETHRLYGGGEPLTVARIWKGSTSELPVGLARDLYVTIPRKRYGDLSAHMNLKATIHAPVARGAALGTVHVNLGDTALTEKPLVALEEVPEGSIWRLLADKVLLLFH